MAKETYTHKGGDELSSLTQKELLEKEKLNEMIWDKFFSVLKYDINLSLIKFQKNLSQEIKITPEQWSNISQLLNKEEK